MEAHVEGGGGGGGSAIPAYSCYTLSRAEAAPAQASPTGGGPSCASGSHSGTAADHATCVVVGLSLSNNGLRGALQEGLFIQLLHLQWVDFRGNELTGVLEECNEIYQQLYPHRITA